MDSFHSPVVGVDSRTQVTSWGSREEAIKNFHYSLIELT
jgi:hypothetical protein